MRNVILACALVASFVCVLHAQLSFEVASIRPSTRTQPAPLPSSPDQLVRAGFTLRQLVVYAFGRDEYTVFGGHDWINSVRFDVTAKAERPVTTAEMQTMTRRLLEERFALKTHTEMRELDVFLLVLARRDGRLGPQLKPSAIDCTPFLAGVKPLSEAPPNERGSNLCMTVGAVWGQRGTGFSHQGRSLDALVARLQGLLRRPVQDRTGLSGAFDVDLKFMPDTQVPVPNGYPPLMTALEEQLGLTLESRREPTEVLVIDDAQPPTPN